jgi:hypothetical protein
VNWVWELETLPTAWSQGVIVNLFKAGDTQLPGNYRGSPWYQSAARCLQTCCASAWSPKCTCTRLRRRSEKILHRQLVRAHAHPPRGKANKTMRSFWTCKAYDTVWRDGLSAKLLEKGVDGKLWRVLRDLAIKSTSQVRVNGDLSEAFPLSAGVGQGDPYLRCCSISYR